MTIIRIAHLSDLHAEPARKFDQERITRAALDDLQAQHALRPVDLAVLSGDLAFSGVEEEFLLADEMLVRPLRERLGLSADRIIIVPGNHDINRKDVIPFVEEGLRKSLASREAVNELLHSKTQLALATQRLLDWNSFHSKFYEGVALETPGPLGIVHRLDISGCSVGVAALDSAWRACGGDEDRRRLLVGDAQIEPCVAAVADCEVQLVVVHHPADWLVPFDGDRFGQYVQRGRLLVLTGHDHLAEPLSVATRHGGAVYSRAGCLYETHDYMNSYSIIDLDVEAETATILVRAWYPGRETGVFDEATAVATNGKVVLSWTALTTDLVARVPRSTVTGALADVAQQTSVVRDAFPEADVQSVEDLLVGPRFLKVPYREAVAAATIKAGIDPDLISDPPEVAPGDVLIVCGDPEFGVTSSLLWLLALRYTDHGDELPIYLNSDVGVGTQRTDRTLAEAAARAGYSRKEQGLPPLLVGIDDVAVRKPNRLARVAKYISEHGENGYILGCHGDEYKALAEALEARGVAPKRVFLAPFGRRELRQLIRKLVGASESALLNRIFRLIRTQSLPRSPLIMAALIAVLRNEEDPGAINESGLLHAYVNYLLGGSELSDAEGLGMDFRRREHLLAYFASTLYLSGNDGTRRLDAESCLLTYFRERGLAFSPGLVLQSLINRRVLIETEGIVRFRHAAFLYLFTAKWMFEDPEFSKDLTQAVLEHASVLKHAAGLRRSDLGLLKSVGEQTLTILNELVSELHVEIFDETLTRDAEEPPELEQLRERLANAPTPPADKEIDERLDRVDDTLEVDDEEPDRPDSAIDEFGRALTLLCDVLRNSELVSDVAVKTELLTEAVRIWSSLAVISAVLTEEEELFGEVVELIKEAGTELKPEELDRELRRLLRMLTLMLVGIGGSAALGSKHLGVAIESALADERVIASPTRAWILTMLYCDLRLHGWPDRLAKLYDAYPEHVFLREVVSDYALALYRSARNQSEANQLEPFLADVFTTRGRRGADSIQKRAAERSQLLEDLRVGRLRYQKVGPSQSLPTETLEEADDG